MRTGVFGELDFRRLARTKVRQGASRSLSECPDVADLDIPNTLRKIIAYLCFANGFADFRFRYCFGCWRGSVRGLPMFGNHRLDPDSGSRACRHEVRHHGVDEPVARAACFPSVKIAGIGMPGHVAMAAGHACRAGPNVD
ncbi:hypothetical protein [Shinella sp. NM-101]|jgi:hypothetical protein|uniref:hypothetical protein n=1 Tax=Shinella TaxID=323620 RepID=UPI001F1F00F5|nr:hypothetical protein [Shinella sp. NM-101]